MTMTPEQVDTLVASANAWLSAGNINGAMLVLELRSAIEELRESGVLGEGGPQYLWRVMYEDLTQDCDGTYPVGPFWVIAGNEDDADNAAGVLLGQMPDRPAEVGTLEIRPATAEEADRFRLVEDELCRGCGHVESLHVADGPVLERACAAEGCACEALGWHFPPIPDQSELIADLARVAKALGEPGFEAHVDEAVRLFARAARRIEVAEAAVAPHDLRRWAAVIRANAAALGRVAALQVELAAARVAPVTPSGGDAMGTAIRDAEDRRSLAEAEANGWPIVRRNVPSADREQRLREYLHQRPRSVSEGHAMAASFRAGWDSALAVPSVAPATPSEGGVPIIEYAQGCTTSDALAEMIVLLMTAWGKGDPGSGVSQHPASYVATFADMARAVLAVPSPDREKLIAEARSWWPGDSAELRWSSRDTRDAFMLGAALAVPPVVNEAKLAAILRIAEIEYAETERNWTGEEGEPETPSAFKARRAVERQREWLGTGR